MDAYLYRKVNELSPGQTVRLVDPHSDIINTQHKPLVKWFPDGLSYNGCQWAEATLTNPNQSIEAIREWLLEIARRGEYEEYPSRFQAVVVFETVKSAKRAARQIGLHDRYDLFKISDVDPTGPFYSQHRRGTTIPEVLLDAEQYWNQTPHRSGEREYLLKCPVTVDSLVDTVSSD